MRETKEPIGPGISQMTEAAMAELDIVREARWLEAVRNPPSNDLYTLLFEDPDSPRL
jgi:hypothetical protein